MAARVRPCSQLVSPATTSEPGQAPPPAGTPAAAERQPREEHKTADSVNPMASTRMGTSPPPVRRKGASKIVKTATRSRIARLAFSSSPPDRPCLVSPLPHAWTGLKPGGERKNLPRAAGSRRSRRPSQTTRIALPRPAISSRRTRRPTHPIPSHLISSIPEQRQSKEKALLFPVGSRVAGEAFGRLLVLSWVQWWQLLLRR
ncbi:hypothetical protein SEVIR_4G097150v4 [Setaria viridis]